MCKNTTPARDGTNFFFSFFSSSGLLLHCAAILVPDHVVEAGARSDRILFHLDMFFRCTPNDCSHFLDWLCSAHTLLVFNAALYQTTLFAFPTTFVSVCTILSVCFFLHWTLDQVFKLLHASGMDVCLLLHPEDFVKILLKKLKAIPNYQEFIPRWKQTRLHPLSFEKLFLFDKNESCVKPGSYHFL